MGFRNFDVTPFQITPITPPGKEHIIKLFQATRTDSGTLKAMLPADTTPYILYLYNNTASNAGTTATVTVTISDNAGTVSTGTASVLSGNAGISIIQMSGFPVVNKLPENGDYKITATYAETGTASTAGGPWTIAVEFVQ